MLKLKDYVILISCKEYSKKLPGKDYTLNKLKESFIEFFLNAKFPEIELEIARKKDVPRAFDLILQQMTDS